MVSDALWCIAGVVEETGFSSVYSSVMYGCSGMMYGGVLLHWCVSK